MFILEAPICKELTFDARNHVDTAALTWGVRLPAVRADHGDRHED